MHTCSIKTSILWVVMFAENLSWEDNTQLAPPQPAYLSKAGQEEWFKRIRHPCLPEIDHPPCALVRQHGLPSRTHKGTQRPSGVHPKWRTDHYFPIQQLADVLGACGLEHLHTGRVNIICHVNSFSRLKDVCATSHRPNHLLLVPKYSAQSALTKTIPRTIVYAKTISRTIVHAKNNPPCHSICQKQSPVP